MAPVRRFRSFGGFGDQNTANADPTTPEGRARPSICHSTHRRYGHSVDSRLGVV